MTDEEDLELNRIDRFTKRSDRAALEVHSHCEVPAGCGGVVLRWVDRQAGIPIRFLIYLDGIGGMTIDGEEPRSSRPILSFGRHVLGVELEGRGLVFAAIRDDVEQPRDFGFAGEQIMFRSEVGADWQYTTAAPETEGWTKPDFDSSTWSPVLPVELHVEDTWSYNRVQELGATGIGGAGGDRFWIRRVFEVRR